MLDSDHSLAYAFCGDALLIFAIYCYFLLLPECDANCISGCDSAGATKCDSACAISHIFNSGTSNCDGLCTHDVLYTITSIY